MCLFKNVFFFRKSYRLRDKVDKYCRVEETRLQHSACWILKATNTHSELKYLLLSHCNNGSTDAPYCYVKSTSALFFVMPHR